MGILIFLAVNYNQFIKDAENMSITKRRELKAIKTKFLNSASRVVLDGVDSGFEAIVLPGISSIYKDGYTNKNGEFIEFTDDQNFIERYGGIGWNESEIFLQLLQKAYSHYAHYLSYDVANPSR